MTVQTEMHFYTFNKRPHSTVTEVWFCSASLSDCVTVSLIFAPSKLKFGNIYYCFLITINHRFKGLLGGGGALNLNVHYLQKCI
jgi:hypothetical protein